MKKASLIGCCLLGVVLLMAATKKPTTSPVKNLEGVWELQHQFIFENDEVNDTMFNLNGYRQVKMYSKGKVMWTRFNPTDTNEWFGYGSYEIKDGMLHERLEYASNEMMKIVDTVQVFSFDLEMGKKTYSQISHDADGNKYVSENYKRVE